MNPRSASHVLESGSVGKFLVNIIVGRGDGVLQGLRDEDIEMPEGTYTLPGCDTGLLERWIDIWFGREISGWHHCGEGGRVCRRCAASFLRLENSTDK